jgi:hypothetical protein
MVKEDEIILGIVNCNNVAFNGNGRIAIIVGRDREFIALEVGRI